MARSRERREGGVLNSIAPAASVVIDASRERAAPRVGNTALTASDVITAVAPSDDTGERTRPFDWRLTLRVGRSMARHPRLFWAIMALAVVLAILNGTFPVLLAETVRGAIETGPHALRGRLGWSRQTWLGAGVAAIAALAIVYYATMRRRQRLVNDLSERVVVDLRGQIFTHLTRLGMDFYDRTKVGRILARGTSDIDALRGAVAQVAPRTTIAVVQMGYALAIMLWYDVLLGAAVAAVAPLLYVANWKFRQRLANAYRRTQESYSLLTANLAESIAGVRVTQAFAREERNLAIFHSLCHLHRGRHMQLARRQGLLLPLMDLTGQVVIAFALLAGGWRVAHGRMSVADLLGFMMMAGVFFGPIVIIGDMYNTTLQALAGAERVFQLIDTEPARLDPDEEQAVPLPRTDVGAGVDFENVSFGYQKDRLVLNDVSFVARPGQTVALVGHTGSGKTSIVNLIAKFYAHDSGRIAIDGIDIRRIRQSDLHAQTGIVNQENFLFTGTVMDNIRFARPDVTDEEVRSICERLGCLDVLERLPRGLQTEVGERGESLSLGQRQLACFARAMLADPRLLILDEATSAVDTVSEARVQAALARLLQGRTAFVVAHRLSTIVHADLILVVRGGRIVEQGTHEELIERGRVYRELYDEFVRLNRGRDRDSLL